MTTIEFDEDTLENVLPAAVITTPQPIEQLSGVRLKRSTTYGVVALLLAAQIGWLFVLGWVIYGLVS